MWESVENERLKPRMESILFLQGRRLVQEFCSLKPVVPEEEYQFLMSLISPPFTFTADDQYIVFLNDTAKSLESAAELLTQAAQTVQKWKVAVFVPPLSPRLTVGSLSARSETRTRPPLETPTAAARLLRRTTDRSANASQKKGIVKKRRGNGGTSTNLNLPGTKSVLNKESLSPNPITLSDSEDSLADFAS